MKERVILHCDINHCYAQIEEMMFPELKKTTMAVGGNEEKRHGIILAKNNLAKQYHIKTGESLHEAYQKCVDLLVIHPHYEDYLYYTEKVKAIYREYSDRVESFGLDEAWIDCTESVHLFGSGLEIAKKLQERVYKEIGLTISIGISFNKIFAKLGSDMIKPSGLVEITKENFKEKAWACPVEDLLYVGEATKQKLERLGIEKIGDLACFDRNVLKNHLGKMGEIIWWFANGFDQSEVALSTAHDRVKSISNGITTPKDMKNLEEVKLVAYVLCESIASRAKQKGLVGKSIRLQMRNHEFHSFSRQKKLTCATNLCDDMMSAVMNILQDNGNFQQPLRSISVALTHLQMENTFIQPSIFENQHQRSKAYHLEKTIDQIRSRYGFDCIKRCSMLLDPELSGFDPQHEHVIFPVGYF